MRNRSRLLIPGGVVAALLAGPAWAQTVPVPSLAEAVSTLPDPFTLIDGVRGRTRWAHCNRLSSGVPRCFRPGERRTADRFCHRSWADAVERSAQAKLAGRAAAPAIGQHGRARWFRRNCSAIPERAAPPGTCTLAGFAPAIPRRCAHVRAGRNALDQAHYGRGRRADLRSARRRRPGQPDRTVTGRSPSGRTRCRLGLCGPPG